MKDYINIGPVPCAGSSSKLVPCSFKSGKQTLAFFLDLTAAKIASVYWKKKCFRIDVRAAGIDRR